MGIITTSMAGLTSDGTASLTNKTIDSYTNFVGADHIHLRVKAVMNLTRGQVVMFMGFNSGEQAIEVQIRNSNPVPAIGVMKDTLANGQFGFAITNGLLKDINTSMWSEGQILYPNLTGGFQTTPSSSTGAYNQPLAYVVRSHAVNGEIMINVGAKETTLPSPVVETVTNSVVIQPSVSTIIINNGVNAVDVYFPDATAYYGRIIHVKRMNYTSTGVISLQSMTGIENIYGYFVGTTTLDTYYNTNGFYGVRRTYQSDGYNWVMLAN